MRVGKPAIIATVADLAYSESTTIHPTAITTGKITAIKGDHEETKMVYIQKDEDKNSTITQIIPAHLIMTKGVGDNVKQGDLLTRLDVSKHSVKVDLDNDGFADEIRYDTNSQRLFVQQLSDEGNAQPFVGQSMGRWTDGSQTTPTAGKITNIQDGGLGRKNITLKPVDQNEDELELKIPAGSKVIVDIDDNVEANEEIIQNDFLAVVPTTSTETAANNVSLRVVDRSFMSEEGRAHWSLSQINAASVEEEVISFETGDHIDLDSHLNLRQKYKLDTEKTPQLMKDIRLILNGKDIREKVGEAKIINSAIQVKLFDPGVTQKTPDGKEASNEKLYFTITNEDDDNQVYTPENGTFIHVLGEVFEIGSINESPDQLKGLRAVLIAGLNSLFGKDNEGQPYGEKLDPIIVEESKWKHDEHKVVEDENITYIIIDKADLSNDQIESIQNKMKELRLSVNADQYSSLSFTLEDLRSGAMRFQFDTPEDPYHKLNNDRGQLQTSIDLLSVTGDQNLKYSLTVTDIGDDRADLIAEWGAQGKQEVYGSLIPNHALHSNTKPIAPHIKDIKVEDDFETFKLSVSVEPGKDIESDLTLKADHNWRWQGFLASLGIIVVSWGVGGFLLKAIRKS